MDTIHQYFTEVVQFARTYEFYVYWLPVVLCIFGYLRQNQKDYKRDIAARTKYETSDNKHDDYEGTLTIGKIVGRIVVSLLPLVNIWKSVFFFIPTIVKDVIDFFNDLLDIPVVPKRPKPVPAPTATVDANETPAERAGRTARFGG